MSNKTVQLIDAEGNNILPTAGMLYRPWEAAQIEAARIYPLPKVNFTLIDPTHTSEVYYKELLKWLCAKYPNVTSAMFIGISRPNAQFPTIISFYDTNVVDQNGYPQYATGMYVNLSGTIYTFGMNNYVYYFREASMN